MPSDWKQRQQEQQGKVLKEKKKKKPLSIYSPIAKIPFKQRREDKEF